MTKTKPTAPVKDEYALKPVETHEKAPSGIQWTNANEAELAKATSDAALAKIVADAASARKTLSEVKGAYASDPLTMFVIGATSQYVMRPAGAGQRSVWRAALVERARAAQDDYIKTFCLDQLRWCGTREDAAKVLQLGANSSKPVNDFAAFVARELNGCPLSHVK